SPTRERRVPPSGPGRYTLGVLVAAVLLFGRAWGAELAAQAGQGTIRGTVIDAGTLRPIAGVQLVVPGTGRQALSNANGQYLILGVPAGARTVRAVMLGYKTGESTVEVVADQTVSLDFSLEASAIDLEEVVVTGSVGGTERRRLGNALSSVGVDRVTERAPINGFEDLVQSRMAGVSVLP